MFAGILPFHWLDAHDGRIAQWLLFHLSVFSMNLQHDKLAPIWLFHAVLHANEYTWLSAKEASLIVELRPCPSNQAMDNSFHLLALLTTICPYLLDVAFPTTPAANRRLWPYQRSNVFARHLQGICFLWGLVTSHDHLPRAWNAAHTNFFITDGLSSLGPVDCINEKFLSLLPCHVASKLLCCFTSFQNWFP